MNKLEKSGKTVKSGKTGTIFQLSCFLGEKTD